MKIFAIFRVFRGLMLSSLLTANAFAQSSLDLRAGWKFATDPKKIGELQNWAAPDFDDAKWTTLDAAKPWEDQGFPDYDGVAWYRKKIEPQNWSEFFLGLGGVDDAYDLFVNGKKAASYGFKRGASVWQTLTVTDITAFVEKEKPIALAIRVHDAGGTGGLVRAPVALASSRDFFDTPEEKIRAQARANPAWIFPAWARGQASSWTMVGMAGGHSHALIASDASYSPRPRAFSIHHWLWLDHQLYAPDAKHIAWKLTDDFLPMPVATWQAGDSVRVTQQWFAWGKDVRDEHAMTFALVTLENLTDAPKTVALLTAIRPYAIAESVAPIQQIFRQDRWTLVNSKLALYCEQPPDAFGAAASADADISSILLTGQMPSAERASDEKGLASAVLKHDLKLEPHALVQLRFRLPLTESEPTAPLLALNDSLDTAMSYSQARNFWSATLSRAKISVPDKKWADAYRASLATLLLSLDGQTFRAGPNGYEVADISALRAAIEEGGLSEAASIVRLAAGNKSEPVRAISSDAKSVETDWYRLVRPHDGALMHRGRIWPALGFDFASELVRQGMRDKAAAMMRWHLAHETFPNLHAWAEQIGRGDKSKFVAGELPSALAAAAYANLFRACFVYERGEQLVLAAGVPLEWMTGKGSKTVELADWPTHFGKLGYRMSYDPSARILRLTMAGDAKPPKGFELRPPVGAYVKGVEFDGKSADANAFTKDFITIPPDVHAVAVKF